MVDPGTKDARENEKKGKDRHKDWGGKGNVKIKCLSPTFHPSFSDEREFFNDWGWVRTPNRVGCEPSIFSFFLPHFPHSLEEKEKSRKNTTRTRAHIHSRAN